MYIAPNDPIHVVCPKGLGNSCSIVATARPNGQLGGMMAPPILPQPMEPVQPVPAPAPKHGANPITCTCPPQYNAQG